MTSINRSLTLNTCVSNNNNASHPSFYLNPPINNVEAFNVSTFSGINTTYTIDSRNCNFSFVESSVPHNGYLPFGNYTINTFITALGTAMTSASGTSTFTITNNVLTNILSITSSTNVFYLTNTINNCYYEAGLTPNNIGSLIQIGTSSYDLSGLKQILLVSSDLGSNAVAVNSNYNVLASIDISVPYLGVISYKGTNLFINSNCTLNSLNFILLDERYRVLSNLKDWSITIILQTE
jgi:hypothetical protein